MRNVESEAYGYSGETYNFDITYRVGTAFKLNESLESRVGITAVELDNGRILDYGVSLIYCI